MIAGHVVHGKKMCLDCCADAPKKERGTPVEEGAQCERCGKTMRALQPSGRIAPATENEKK